MGSNGKSKMASNQNQKMTFYRRVRSNLPSHPKTPFYKFSNKLCMFKGYNCPQYTLQGYSYCVKHILLDEKAPFQPCSFAYQSIGKKCPRPAPKYENGDSFCLTHLKKEQSKRNRAGKSEPPLSREKLLVSLKHHAKLRRASQEGQTSSVNPFQDLDAGAANTSVISTLNYCSESDSDVEPASLGRTARCDDEDSSDAESIDSISEDPLKYASVLTAEEVLTRARDKSNKLRDLYVKQLDRLRYILAEKKRDYCEALQKEKETLCSIAEQSKVSAKEMKLAEKIKGYNHYRKYYGVEAVLRKKSKDKKKGLSLEAGSSRPGMNKCIFTEGGVKCSVRTIPTSRFCTKHILNDPFQVLFRACGIQQDEDVCKEPLAGMEPCIYHIGMVPAQISYNTMLSSEDEIDQSGVKQEQSIADQSLDCTAEVKTEAAGEGMTTEVISMDLDGTQCIISNEFIECEQVVEMEETI